MPADSRCERKCEFLPESAVRKCKCELGKQLKAASWFWGQFQGFPFGEFRARLVFSGDFPGRVSVTSYEKGHQGRLFKE